MKILLPGQVEVSGGRGSGCLKRSGKRIEDDVQVDPWGVEGALVKLRGIFKKYKLQKRQMAFDCVFKVIPSLVRVFVSLLHSIIVMVSYSTVYHTDLILVYAHSHFALCLKRMSGLKMKTLILSRPALRLSFTHNLPFGFSLAAVALVNITKIY